MSSSRYTAQLSSETYTFLPTDPSILPTTANRYWKGPANAAGVTLICAHCTTSHKEAYEPFVEDLYAALPTGFIREVWAIEHPNHGEAAVMNEATLLTSPYNTTFLWRYGAETIHAFINGLGTGVDVDFSKRRVIGIGQSSGACLLTLAMSIQPNITPEHLFIIEPIAGHSEYTASLSALVVKMNTSIKNRRDVWPNREEARKDLANTGIWKYYDERVFESYLKHGLRDLPMGTHGSEAGSGVTLACTLAQEVAIQSDPDGPVNVFDMLPQLAKRTKLHLVWSKIHHPMLLPLELKTRANERVRPQSIIWVDGPHLLLQLNPRGLAQAMSDSLTKEVLNEFEWEGTKL